MIKDIITARLAYWAQAICEQVINKWGGYQGGQEILSETAAITPELIATEIIASGMGAWIMEFGSGSALDVGNPFFSNYISSDMWNAERAKNGNEFLGRKKGDKIYRPDGTIDISSGRAEGMRLEHSFSGYEPELPRHIIRDEITFTMPLIQEDIISNVLEYISGEITASLRSDILL